ncbi:MAG: N-acetylmuramic acid 6-phosphate etherase [Planctomycetes bacterium]|nr:N-acetylmuramic acid 6-phosphate etherase [Planctomycetota bacterium]MCB9888929.1 N-acetylmuramic acid 6-phosphate etherase [Planctomycetota bacterium]
MDWPHDPLTEADNPASARLDTMSATEVVRLMNAQDAGVVAAVHLAEAAIAGAIEGIAQRLGSGGRLFYVGAGTSGRLGVLDAAECPPTFNSDPALVQALIAGGDRAVLAAVEGAEDDAMQGGIDLERRGLGAGDAVVGIAASGTTPYVRGALEYANRCGAFTVALTCNPESPLAAIAAHPITVVVGPEILTGSTRLKAGTATKMVLNAISTAVMVKLGKTYGNLMVDLQATNHKLRQRALRLVCRLANLDPRAGASLLDRCGQDLKTSVVAARLGLAPAAARARLQQFGGHLRAALGEQP